MYNHYEHKHSCCNNWLWAQPTRLLCDCLQTACSKTIGNFAAYKERYDTYMMVIREFVLALLFCAHMCLQLCDNASCMRKETKLQSTVGTHACFGNAISVPRSSSSSSGNMFALLAKNMGTALAESGEKRQTTLCMYFLAIFPFQLQSNSCCLRALSSQLWQLVTQSSAICGRQSGS